MLAGAEVVDQHKQDFKKYEFTTELRAKVDSEIIRCRQKGFCRQAYMDVLAATNYFTIDLDS